MNSLAIEASSECCSVALEHDGETLSRQAIEPRGHALRILPWVDELLADAGIGHARVDRLVVSRGPGGFTSLRIGLAIVQGLALAHDLPVHPVSSLEVLAQSGDPERRQSHLLAILDARMGEVYAAWYRVANGRRERIGEEWLGAPRSLRMPAPGPWQACGPGVQAFRDELTANAGPELTLPDPDAAIVWPSARALLELADQVEGVPGHRITPSYLRDQVTG